MLKKNDVIEVTIDATGYEGEGIAHVDGIPVFVRYAAEGDRLMIRIVKTNKKFAFGIVDKILEPSEDRVNPACASFGKCGGCAMMHVTYEKQLQVKKNTVLNNLRKIAHLGADDYIFDELIGSEQYNYRNKAQFPLSVENGKAFYGFYAPGSHRVVKCGECSIQNKKINDVVKATLEYINENSVSVYDEKAKTGFLRHVFVRTSENGDFVLTLVTNGEKELPQKEKLVEKLKALGGLKGVVQNINTRSDNIIMGDKNVLIFGNEKLTMNLSDLKFNVSPNSFFQVNINQTEKLYKKALDYAGLTGNETVFDLYCGVGSISLFLAQSAKMVYGVEIVEDAVENAKANAELNKIENAKFFCGDCPKIVKELVANGVGADVVIVDPPRKGCDDSLLDLIKTISPKKVVYVSCNSATLARDVDILSQYGYKLKKLSAVDMFPQTAHVECVALLVNE